MSCPKCRSRDTEETSCDPDIKFLHEAVYVGSSFLVKISGHDHFFVALNLGHEDSKQMVYFNVRIRYGFVCAHCGYEWDLMWPSTLQVDGRIVT